jgi:DNA-binding MarR family transcriptional regulator
VHALLDKPDAWYRASELADLINVAVSTVSRSFIELERMELVETRGKGPKKERHLTKPTALLDAWAEIVRAEPAPPSRRYFVSGALGQEQLVNEMAHMLEEANVEYALTGEAAAQRYNPFLTSVPLARFRVENIEQAEKVLTARKVRRVDEGANLVLIDTPEKDELLFKQSIDGISVVSPIQAYIDLQQLPGRAKEAAQHLREERLGYLK